MGSASRSFRKAETGVWQSSMNVSRRGIRLCSRASTLTSSSVGDAEPPHPAPVISALATAIQHPLGVGERQAASPKQHREVIHHVRGLFGHSLIGFLARGSSDLLCFLLHLRADLRGVREQGRGV